MGILNEWNIKENELENLIKYDGIEELEEDFSILGIGGGRTVFDYNENFVLKVPHSEDGEHQNRIEYNVYDKYKNSKFASLLAPCYLYKGDTGQYNYLLMEKIPIILEYQIKGNIIQFAKDNFPQQVDEIEELIDELSESQDLWIFDIIDLTAWGIKDNRLILIDYGIDTQTYEEYYN